MVLAAGYVGIVVVSLILGGNAKVNKTGSHSLSSFTVGPQTDTKCFNCLSVSQLNGKSLYTQGWKPKETFPVIADCWSKPAQESMCKKGCVKIVAIGEATDDAIVRELKKANSAETRVRMIYRTCGEVVDSIKLEKGFKTRSVPGTQCSFMRGAVSVIGKKSAISACNCKDDLCNKEEGVVYAIKSKTTCSVSLRLYSQQSNAPKAIAKAKVGKINDCTAFCKKYTAQCSNVGFKPQEHKDALCFMSDSADDCVAVVDERNGNRFTLPPTEKKAKLTWVFCNVCSK